MDSMERFRRGVSRGAVRVESPPPAQVLRARAVQIQIQGPAFGLLTWHIC